MKSSRLLHLSLLDVVAGAGHRDVIADAGLLHLCMSRSFSGPPVGALQPLEQVHQGPMPGSRPAADSSVGHHLAAAPSAARRGAANRSSVLSVCTPPLHGQQVRHLARDVLISHLGQRQAGRTTDDEARDLQRRQHLVSSRGPVHEARIGTRSSRTQPVTPVAVNSRRGAPPTARPSIRNGRHVIGQRRALQNHHHLAATPTASSCWSSIRRSTASQ